MISVVGEALVDLVITPDGSVEAKLGGAPYNTARACGRLGAAVRFVGALSVDRFGVMLAEQLVADGVDVADLHVVVVVADALPALVHELAVGADRDLTRAREAVRRRSRARAGRLRAQPLLPRRDRGIHPPRGAR